MKTVSVRELRYDFKSVERLLRSGEEVRITKRREVIARLVPEPMERPPMPDFMARMRANFGDKVLEVSGAELISADRDGRSVSMRAPCFRFTSGTQTPRRQWLR